jgi:predicted O-methyltransferase YrrM
MNVLSWLRYKFWYYELAAFISEQKLTRGTEIGVKAGRSFCTFLRMNPQLHMVGVDLWENQPNSPYANNAQNEQICRERSAKFKNRVQLVKGEASEVASEFGAHQFDFAFYDCYNYRISTPEFHKRILAAWLPKIRKGGYLVGRDFHEPDVVEALRQLGYEDIQPVTLKGRESVRLKYVKL